MLTVSQMHDLRAARAEEGDVFCDHFPICVEEWRARRCVSLSHKLNQVRLQQRSSNLQLSTRTATNLKILLTLYKIRLVRKPLRIVMSPYVPREAGFSHLLWWKLETQYQRRVQRPHPLVKQLKLTESINVESRTQESRRFNQNKTALHHAKHINFHCKPVSSVNAPFVLE